MKLLLLLLLLQAPQQAQSLQESLDALVRQAEAMEVRTGVYLRQVREKTPFFERRSAEAFLPASNMKLFTAAFLLEELGEAHRFRTSGRLFRGEGTPVLQLVAGGDPCLADSIPGGWSFFAELVAELRERGITKLRLHLDDRSWPGPSRPPGWPRDQLDRRYAAPTGGFVLNRGCIRVRLSPERASGVCAVSLGPGRLRLPIRGSVKLTQAGKKKKPPTYGGAMDEKGLRLWGSFPASSRGTEFETAAWDPRDIFARVLQGELAHAGIEVASFLEGPPEGKAEEIFRHDSPIRPLFLEILRNSSNFMAEQGLRVLAFEKAGEGSLAKGRALLHERFGPGRERASEWRVADGSGLSRGNRVSPRLIGELLCALHATPLGKPYMGVMARSGVHGTLRRRMRGAMRGAVAGKTGWIRGASALSGYLRCRSGKVLAFSILMNYDPGREGLNARLKRLQDRLVGLCFERF